ncbi:MAG TPA: hypothetical protein ACQGQJ_02980 [Xylella fastidiosa subsp. multiplex]
MKLKYLVMLMLVPAVVGVAVPSALAQAPKASMQPPASPSTDMPTNSEGQSMGEHRDEHKAKKVKKHRSHTAKPTNTGSAAAPTKEAEENTAVTR